MYKYLKEHEKAMIEALRNESYNWQKLKEYHYAQIQFMQHERLVHLIVTIAFAMFLLFSIFLAIYFKSLEFTILCGLFFVLLAPYIMHYYRLENGVQRWYELYNEIENKCK